MDDTEICRKVLEKILNISIKRVEIPTTQKTINILYEGKGVRLDVYVNDDEGTVYNVEMQRGKSPELPKRTRYYQRCIDLDLIQAGSYYTELKKRTSFSFVRSILFPISGTSIRLKTAARKILLLLLTMKS